MKFIQFESGDFVGAQDLFHVNLDLVVYLTEGKDTWYVYMNGQHYQVTKSAFDRIKAALYERSE